MPIKDQYISAGYDVKVTKEVQFTALTTNSGGIKVEKLATPKEIKEKNYDFSVSGDTYTGNTSIRLLAATTSQANLKLDNSYDYSKNW